MENTAILTENGIESLSREINQAHLPYIMNLDARDICLFLPHCLRSRDCPASSDHEGIICEKCERCDIARLVSEGEARGLRVFCVPGGSLIETLVKKYRPKAVVGVACSKEITLALQLLWDKGIFVQAFPLERDGCFQTSVKLETILAFLSHFSPRRAASPVAAAKQPERPWTSMQ